MTIFNILLPILMMSIGRTSAELSSKSWERNNDLSGKLFDNPMFEITARGRLHCAMRCSRESCCQTMTYNPTTKGCRGYCRKTGVGEELTTDPGRELYQRINPPVDYICGYDTNTKLCFSLKTDLQDLQTKYGAADQCRLDNGYLIMIDTVERLSAVEGVLLEYLNGAHACVWIDGEDFTNTNNYVMSNGNTVPITNTLWSPGEPANLVSETCVCISTFKDYKAHDVGCHQQQYAYLCEY